MLVCLCWDSFIHLNGMWRCSCSQPRFLKVNDNSSEPGPYVYFKSWVTTLVMPRRQNAMWSEQKIMKYNKDSLNNSVFREVWKLISFEYYYFRSQSSDKNCTYKWQIVMVQRLPTAHIWACTPSQLHCGTYFGTPNFFKLILSWIWAARLEENRPVRSQFPIKSNLSMVEYARFDWLYGLVRVPLRKI